MTIARVIFRHGEPAAMPDMPTPDPAPPRCTRGRLPRGFTLLEVLVTVLVLTIGLLGLAALQITALKSTGSAQLSTAATIAAYDTIDRLRTDPMTLKKSAPTLDMPADPCGSVGSADGAAIKRWYQGICALGLTQSTNQASAVTVDCSGAACGSGNCEIRVYWDNSRTERGIPNATSDKSFKVCTRLALR